jgi:phosphomethylpyrimidine synthase
VTQLSSARKGQITPEMEQVARKENVALDFVVEGVAAGTIVIPRNVMRKNMSPVGIGTGLTTKVSASVGVFGNKGSIDSEIAKIQAAMEAGTHSIMDLSVSGDIDAMRKKTLATTPTPVGTLPLYQAVAEAAQEYGSSVKMKVEDLLEVIERQAADGVDFLALHSGTTKSIVERAKQEGRVDPLVSYGGSHLPM